MADLLPGKCSAFHRPRLQLFAFCIRVSFAHAVDELFVSCDFTDSVAVAVGRVQVDENDGRPSPANRRAATHSRRSGNEIALTKSASLSKGQPIPFRKTQCVSLLNKAILFSDV